MGVTFVETENTQRDGLCAAFQWPLVLRLWARSGLLLPECDPARSLSQPGFPRGGLQVTATITGWPPGTGASGH